MGGMREIFLKHSFKKYKGFCVTPVGTYFTMSIAPLYRAKGSNDVPETAPARTLLIRLHEGKVATDNSVLSHIAVNVLDVGPRAFTLSVADWLAYDSRSGVNMSEFRSWVSPTNAKRVAKVAGEAYEEILNSRT